MSFKFGKKSLERLAEIHPDLQKICNELIKEMDVTILCGYRGKEEQNTAFINGKSKLQFPNSKHNKKLALAVDIAPSPIDWNDLRRFIDMCAAIEVIADKLKIPVILGRDFSFRDYPHVELATEKEMNSGYYMSMKNKRRTKK